MFLIKRDKVKETTRMFVNNTIEQTIDSRIQIIEK